MGLAPRQGLKCMHSAGDGAAWCPGGTCICSGVLRGRPTHAPPPPPGVPVPPCPGIGTISCPDISREEIVNACGIDDFHDGVNYTRTACVIAVSKAKVGALGAGCCDGLLQGVAAVCHSRGSTW